jgi:hypothetical protein
MKNLITFLPILFLFTNLSVAQDNAGDSQETLKEQQLALMFERQEGTNTPTQITEFDLQITHPLFVGVDDVTIPAYLGNPATNDWIQAFVGAEVWGAAYDPVNDKVYFNNGSTLYEWPVGGTITQLGAIIDSTAANLSVVSLAFYNGELYATRNIANEAVYKINLSTLLATPVIDYTDADFDFGGLAIDPTNGDIYGTNDDTSPFGSGLFRINPNGSGTLIAPYPAGESDIDGLAVSDGRIAYLVIDQPGNIYSYDLANNTYGDTLVSPWTTSEVFSGATWLYEIGGGLGVMLISDNTIGTDSVEARLTVLGKTFTRFTNSAALSMPTSDWLQYDAVFWIGYAGIGAEIDSCTAYLNSGGRLLVADNDQGYFSGSTSFFKDYLMAVYLTDDGSVGTINGLDMMNGLSINISADPWPDDIGVNTGIYGTGVPIFLAPTNTTYAGMRGDGGTFRTQLLCWDPQYGDSYSTNLSILERTINWLVDGIIPVELTSFTANVKENDIELNWETATELNNSGFSVERKSVNSVYKEVGFVPGSGTTTEPRSYTFIDPNLTAGIYTYRLKQIDYDGSTAYSDEVSVEVKAPVAFSLEQNYPNPFNPNTVISFSLAAESRVTLKVFDLLGQEVVTLVNGDYTQGSHKIEFNGSKLNSGVYFYKLEANSKNGQVFTDNKKMILIK